MQITNDHFEWDGYSWKAEITLASWRGFQSRRGPYGAQDSEQPSDGTVDLIFAPEGRGDEPLNDGEIALVQWFLDHEDAIPQAVLSSLAEEYPRLQDQYGYSPEERAEYMPDLNSAEELRGLIGLSSVNVHQISKGGMPYVGLELGCTWDHEPGLGILLHGGSVVEIGGADTAIYLWIAKKHSEES